MKKIAVVGCGPGSADFLTRKAEEVVAGSEVVFGSERLLDLFELDDKKRKPIGRIDSQLIDQIVEDAEARRVAVLVSGDTGIYSLASVIASRVGRENCELIPGISSVQLAFARIGECWQDARIISLHGRDSDKWAADAAKHPKLAFLTDEHHNPSSIARELLLHGPNRRAFVCEDLTMPGERVVETELEKLPEQDYNSRNILIVLEEVRD